MLALTEEGEAIPCQRCGELLSTERFCPNCGAANPIRHIDESLRVEPARVSIYCGNGGGKSRRKLIAGLSAVTAVAIILASFFANYYALNHFQFRVREVSNFDFISLSSTMQIDICNPTPFPASFDEIKAVVRYHGDDFAIMTIGGGLAAPYQSTTFTGRLSLNTQTVSGLIIALAAELSGHKTSYEQDNISIIMTKDAKILGLVPYSQTIDLTFTEFIQLVGTLKQGNEYSCA